MQPWHRKQKLCVRLSTRGSHFRRQRVDGQAEAHDVASLIPNPKTIERNHLESSFLRLPPELRQQIYDAYFEPGTVIIQKRNGTVFAPKRPPQNPGIVRVRPNRSHVSTVRKGLDLTLTCRQIYIEAIQYLYTTNTFRLPFYPYGHLPNLHILPEKHHNTLRSLELYFDIDSLVERFDLKHDLHHPGPTVERTSRPWLDHVAPLPWKRSQWAALWASVSALPQLKQLVVAFVCYGKYFHADDNAWMFGWILAPLVHYKRQETLATFEVEWERSRLSIIEWWPSEGWLKAMPFEMIQI